MPKFPNPYVARVVPNDVDVAEEEARAILEIAYLMTMADGAISDAERLALADVGRKIAKTESNVDTLLNAFAKNVEHARADERLTVLAGMLQRKSARELAYQVSFAMKIADLGTGDAEDDFDDDLIEALGLSADDADRLADAVFATLDGPKSA